MSKSNINNIELVERTEGVPRRIEILEAGVDKSTLLPKPVVYKDLDDAMKGFVESLKMVSDEGITYPTMTLYSNQRFSEYSQTWKHLDENNNLLLNFKTINRDNNPQKGTIVGASWNIPGKERFYLIKQYLVLDENGTESLMSLKMRQPMSIDLNYKVSIFTTKYQSLNEFNTKINTIFKAKQAYIQPCGYYMPIVLDGISDESEYSIDDRQFYSQTFNIKLMAYIITKDDYRVYERPYKRGVSFVGTTIRKKKPEIEVDVCGNPVEHDEYEYEGIELTIDFPTCVNKVSFVMDSDIVVEGYEFQNLSKSFKLYINDEQIDTSVENITIHECDEVTIYVKQRNIQKGATLTLVGYDPNSAVKIEA